MEPAAAEHAATRGLAVWLKARQDTADALLFEDAVPTLAALRGAGVVVGGITNGNGDPREV